MTETAGVASIDPEFKEQSLEALKNVSDPELGVNIVDLGLIYAPHVSAGRLPTQQGLRFFVDALMQIGDVNLADRQSIEAQLAAFGKTPSVEGAMSDALSHLSGLTRAAACDIVTASFKCGKEET